jgi:hypothetical protein
MAWEYVDPLYTVKPVPAKTPPHKPRLPWAGPLFSVLVSLAQYADFRSGRTTSTYESLALRIGYSRGAVFKAVHGLIALGFVTKVTRHHGRAAHTFELNYEPVESERLKRHREKWGNSPRRRLLDDLVAGAALPATVHAVTATVQQVTGNSPPDDGNSAPGERYTGGEEGSGVVQERTSTAAEEPPPLRGGPPTDKHTIPDPREPAQARAALATDPQVDGNYRVVLKLAHQVLDELGAACRSADDGEAVERLKTACAQARVAYDSDLVARTLAAAFMSRIVRTPGRSGTRRPTEGVTPAGQVTVDLYKAIRALADDVFAELGGVRPEDPEACERLKAKCDQAGIACTGDEVPRALNAAFMSRVVRRVSA